MKILSAAIAAQLLFGASVTVKGPGEFRPNVDSVVTAVDLADIVPGAAMTNVARELVEGELYGEWTNGLPIRVGRIYRYGGKFYTAATTASGSVTSPTNAMSVLYWINAGEGKDNWKDAANLYAEWISPTMRSGGDYLFAGTGEYHAQDSRMLISTNTFWMYDPDRTKQRTMWSWIREIAPNVDTSEFVHESDVADMATTQDVNSAIAGLGSVYMKQAAAFQLFQPRGEYLSRSDLVGVEMMSHAEETYQPIGDYVTAGDLDNWTRTGTVHAAESLKSPYIAIGVDASLGQNNQSNAYGIAIGNKATVNGLNDNEQAIAIGRGAYAGMCTNAAGTAITPALRGDASIAIGSKAKAYGQRGISIGYRTENYGISAVAIGSAQPTQPDGDPWHLTIASNDYTVAIGHNAQALAKGAAQIGWGTNTTANTLKFRNTTIVDANGKVLADEPQFNSWTNLYSLPLARGKTYGKNNTVAIGNAAETFNADAFAFGSEARVKVMDGTNVAASAGGAIQLGNGINSERTSLQFRGTKIVNGQGKIPTASLEAATAIGQIGNKADKGELNNYLKLSGGTMTGKLTASDISAKSVDTDGNTLRVGNVRASGSDSIVVGRNGSYTTNTVAGIVIGPNTIVSAEQGIAIGGRNNEGVVGTGKVCRVTASGAVQIGVGENGEANSLKFGNAAGTRNTTIVNGQGKIPTASLELKDEFQTVKGLAESALQTETDPTVGMTNNIIYIKGQHIAPITSHQSLANYYTKGQTDAKIVELAYQKVAGKVVLCPTTGGTTGADSISISVGPPGASHTAAVAIGAQAFASGAQSIAIGGRNDGDAKKCYATALGAVQIGSGRNSEVNSLKFGNSSGTINTTIVGSNGYIPTESLEPQARDSLVFANSVAQYMLGNTNAWFEGTNYNADAMQAAGKVRYAHEGWENSAETPTSLQLHEIRNGARQCVWDQRDWTAYYTQARLSQLSNSLADATASLGEHVRTNYMRRGWSKYTAVNGLDNPATDTTWIDTPKVSMMAGKQWELAAETGGCGYYTLAGNGIELGPEGTNTYLTIRDFEGNACLTFRKTSSYLVYCDIGTDLNSQDVDENGQVGFHFTTNLRPTGEFSTTLDSAAFVDEDEASCPATATWSGGAGNWTCRFKIKQGINSTRCFARFKIEQQGENIVEHHIPVKLNGGIVFEQNGTTYKIRPTISGSTVSWEVVQ